MIATQTDHHAQHWLAPTNLAPIASAFLDHGETWVSIVGVCIGAVGLCCQLVMTAIRVREFVASKKTK